MKMEYEEENGILKTRYAALKHEMQMTTMLKQRHENEKKTMTERNDRYRCTIHQMEKQIEELKNELFTTKTERGDEVIIVDTVIHHDAKWRNKFEDQIWLFDPKTRL